LLSSDEEAQFFDFHAKTSAAFFKKAYRMSRGHEADARDALQQAYLKALDNWVTVGVLNDAQRHGWLARTLTNEVLQIWRKPYRSRETQPGDDAIDGLVVHAADSMDDKDELRSACRAIARLEGRPREVIALHCLAGYEIDEVAEILGISASTVRVHLHNARMRIRGIMAGEEALGNDHT
jgi:RNA polymerase sigma-70 factor (ECF subfamily)